MSKDRSLYLRISRRISREGIIEVLYNVLARFDYPINGFPRYGVDEFTRASSREVRDGALLLDAGAGHRPYRSLFDHTRYQSCDYLPVIEETGGNPDIDHTFFCDLEDIPKEAGIYDAIICNQVLEHVKRPGKVIDEFYRILKPGGKFFLTAPQCSGIHMAPHNYFNFTSYGLKLLFEATGFRVVSIKPLGGIFWLLGKVMQKGYEAFLSRLRGPTRALYLPVHILVRACIFIISFSLFHLDKLDKEKGWTLNYGCYCEKPLINEASNS